MFSRVAIIVLGAVVVAAGKPAWADDALRDPTRPWGGEARVSMTTPAFVVSAILISEQRRVAVLNGRAVTAGDRVDGATVRAIGPGKVQLSFQGRDFEAVLSKGKIRQ